MSKMLYGDGGLEQLVQPVETAALQGLIGDVAVEFVGDVAAATHVISNVADTSMIDVGDRIYGQDPAAARVVVSKTSTTVTVDGNGYDDQAAAKLVAIKPAGQPLGNCKVILITDDLSYPIKSLTIDDVTPATFDGYAASSAVVWGNPFDDLNGNVVITGDKKQFLCTGDTVNDAVTAACLVSADGMTLLAVNIFGTPIGLENAGDALDYVPTLSFVIPSE